MAWVHDNYINYDHSVGHKSKTWSDVDNFDDGYVNTHYWWSKEAVNDYIPQHNNACAIWLLIDRCNYLESEISELSVSMDSILSAMVAANPHQVESFVGLVDAYRQSIWNRPFNQEFFAALARGFM